MAEPFEISLAAISKHLHILTRAGLIEQEKRGRVKWCKLQMHTMKDASIWMESFGQFENVNLDAFEKFLEQEIIQVKWSLITYSDKPYINPHRSYYVFMIVFGSGDHRCSYA